MADPKMLTPEERAQFKADRWKAAMVAGPAGYTATLLCLDRQVPLLEQHADAADLALAAKDAEIARLRAALEDIYDHGGDALAGYDSELCPAENCECCDRAMERARRALARTP